MPVPPNRQNGRMLRGLRTKYAVNQSLEELAEAAGLNADNIRERWECGARPSQDAFWKYIEVLLRSADKAKKLVDFLKDLDPLVERWYPIVYKVLAKTAGDDDSRTREEWSQDLADCHRDPEINRPDRLRLVARWVASLPAPIAGPKEVLPIEEIEKVSSWQNLPDKAFAMNLVFPIEDSTITLHRRDAAVHRTPLLLTVDLRNQVFGIYNERGKKLLRSKFVDVVRGPVLSQASATIHQFLMSLNRTSGETSWRTLMDGDLVPLRWASAGILPVARCFRSGHGPEWVDDGEWVTLFFRDISPLGLNVGNGATESVRESLEELSSREGAEELVLTKRRPALGERVEQLIFYDQDGGRALNNTDVFRQFLQQHRQLRYQHDNVDIEVGNRRRFLVPLTTPFAVRVFEDGPAGTAGAPPAVRISRYRDVIFSVNPRELGIEVIRPYRFDFYEGEWLMDGEILPSSRALYPYLVRRPVVMIRLDFLRGQFRDTGSLGEILDDPAFLGGKRLPEIPPSDYKVFVDLEARRRRLAAISAVLAGSPDAAVRRSLESEHGLIEGWLQDYGAIFEEAESRSGPLRADVLRTLCPVTFKTLELAFAHRVPGF